MFKMRLANAAVLLMVVFSAITAGCRFESRQDVENAARAAETVIELAQQVAQEVESEGAGTVAESTDATPKSKSKSKSKKSVSPIDVDYPVMPKGTPEQILVKLGYVTSYNNKTKNPNWVAWHLHAKNLDGPYERKGSPFKGDKNVPEPRAEKSDYVGVGNLGLSRGHMCPAGDNTWSTQAMVESFLLTNICPQDGKLNSGAWNSVESECRDYAERFGDVYIVCGPIFSKSEAAKTIGENKVRIPDAFFKVILCLNGQPKALGYIVKNNSGTKKKDLYVNTLRQVERVTGIKFFPNLPADVRKAIEDVADLSQWQE